MLTVGPRIIRMVKGFLATFFLACFLAMLAILRTVEYSDNVVRRYANEQQDVGTNNGFDNKKEPSNSIIRYQTFPRGGDEVPEEPEWEIPERTVYNDTDLFLNNISQKYFVANFSISPGQGNIMFQYASLLALALENDAALIVPENLLIRRSFLLPSATFVTSDVMTNLSQAWSARNRHIYPNCCSYYRNTTQPEFLAETINRTAEGHGAFFYGYFQSFRYFHPQLSRQIREEEFAFLPHVKREAASFVERALTAKGLQDRQILIGVHVRHGMDVTMNIRNIEHGHLTAPKKYIRRAMDHFRNRFNNTTNNNQSSIAFVVCSDDYYWSKRHLDAPDTVFIRSGSREIDLAVLATRCNHTVMSQGTFSWWAAYLTGGETVYYNRWPRPGSKLSQMTVKTDFFLPQWTPMV